MKLRKSDTDSGAGEGGGRRRVLVAGGITAGVAAVGIMALVLLPGGDDEVPLGLPPGQSAVTSTASTTAAPTARPTSTAIKKFTGRDARDPFKALVVEAAAAPAGAPVGSSLVTPAPAGPVGSVGGAVGGGSGGVVSGPRSTATSVPLPTITKVPTVPAPQPTTTSPTVPPATPAPVTTISMVAVSPGDTSARIKVNKTFYEVKPLAEFGTYFKLLNLREGRCGSIQYGDVVFDLCEGQTRTIR